MFISICFEPERFSSTTKLALQVPTNLNIQFLDPKEQLILSIDSTRTPLITLSNATFTLIARVDDIFFHLWCSVQRNSSTSAKQVYTTSS